jgi:outer membrane biosynthesis protein TonB
MLPAAGWQANVDSQRVMLDALGARQHADRAPGARFLFTSSTAAIGSVPPGGAAPDDLTKLLPQNTYGFHKASPNPDPDPDPNPDPDPDPNPDPNPNPSPNPDPNPDPDPDPNPDPDPDPNPDPNPNTLTLTLTRWMPRAASVATLPTPLATSVRGGHYWDWLRRRRRSAMPKGSGLSHQPAGSPEAAISARSRPRLPRAPASLGPSAAWAALAGRIWPA